MYHSVMIILKFTIIPLLLALFVSIRSKVINIDDNSDNTYKQIDYHGYEHDRLDFALNSKNYSILLGNFNDRTLSQLASIRSSQSSISLSSGPTILSTSRRLDQSSDHSLVSPSEGTDILGNPTHLIKAFNQSRTIKPKLELNRDFIVYLCRHQDNGIRFYFLTREGLLLHPRIRLTYNPSKAEFIVYLPTSSPWENTECNRPEYRNKTVILDEGDGPGLFQVHDSNPNKFFLYFKRSYVSRSNGVFEGFMKYVSHGEIFPMTYPMGETYVRLEYNPYEHRELEILCTLRGSNHDPVRLRVRQWIEEYIQARGLRNAVAKQVNTESRRTISRQYFQNMYNAKIIVTSNPSGWEGDFRFCEALASGALIFIDFMMVPRPYPFRSDHHIVYYDNRNKTDLFDKLDFYRQKKDLAKRIAMQGYLHAMKHHRAMNLIDYVFKTVHVKVLRLEASRMRQSNLRGSVSADHGYRYTQTGYDILRIAQESARSYRLRDHG